MNALEKASLILINAARDTDADSRSIDARARIMVTVAYLAAVLSVSSLMPSRLILLGAYPMVASVLGNISYKKVVGASLIMLPVFLIVGIFNPLIGKTTAYHIGTIAVTHGWAMCIALVLRGVLAVQGAMVLVMSTGFNSICRALGRMHVPGVFITILMMVYRYIAVLLEEASSMDKARRSRGYGKRNYNLRLWSTLIGQLLLRSVDRAERINRAMISRGFVGVFPSYHTRPWHMRDTLYTILWIAAFVLVLTINPDTIFQG